jgi:nucleolar protein 12
VVGKKRKAPDDVAVAAAGGAGDEEDEAFDDEGKLLRTVFVGNLPLRTKKKALTKEFAPFGEVESVRIRSVPLTDVSAISLNYHHVFYAVEGFGLVC